MISIFIIFLGVDFDGVSAFTALEIGEKTDAGSVLEHQNAHFVECLNGVDPESLLDGCRMKDDDQVDADAIEPKVRAETLKVSILTI